MIFLSPPRALRKEWFPQSERSVLSPPLSEEFDLAALRNQAAALVEAATRAGADAADAVAAASRATGVEVRHGRVEETESAESAVFTLRAFVGDRSAAISANQADDIDDLSQRVVAMAQAAPGDPLSGLAPANRLANNIPDLDLFDATAISFEEMKDHALACEEAGLAMEGVTKSGGAAFGRSLGGMVLATSHGFVGSYRTSRFSLSASFVSGEGTAMVRDHDFDSQRHLEDLRTAEEIGKRAADRTVRRAGAIVPQTGSGTIVFEPRTARSLVSHLAAALNGSAIVRKTSFLRDDLGKRICEPNVMVVDEPHIRRGVASRPFDGEGALPVPLSLLQNGILSAWLLDGRTARQLGLTSNGRASRSGSSTSPSSTNLVMSAGEQTPQDLIGSIDSGILVTELIGQGVNLVTGDYSRGASGYLIEKGEITRPVSEFTIAGNLRTMLAGMIPASDLERRHATNAPTTVIEDMTIAGQ